MISFPRSFGSYMRKPSNVARVVLAVGLGILWSLVWFKGFGLLAIVPGVALTALILFRPVKAVVAAWVERRVDFG